jgi:succinyl-CoA synthetase beta subunit
MDLLEYQGKQLFAKHGVPVPRGIKLAKDRAEAEQNGKAVLGMDGAAEKVVELAG